MGLGLTLSLHYKYTKYYKELLDKVVLMAMEILSLEIFFHFPFLKLFVSSIIFLCIFVTMLLTT